MKTASAYADSFLALVQRDYRDNLIPYEARAASSVADLADYADTARYFRIVLGDLAGDAETVRSVAAEIGRRLSCRGHHDEIPAPVTPLTGPHQLGFARGSDHANALDGDVPETDRPDTDERQSDWNDAQWAAYVDGWLEAIEVYEDFGAIGARIADGRYYECRHRTL
jgi:hypothetical protein